MGWPWSPLLCDLGALTTLRSGASLRSTSCGSILQRSLVREGRKGQPSRLIRNPPPHSVTLVSYRTPPMA